MPSNEILIRVDSQTFQRCRLNFASLQRSFAVPVAVVGAPLGLPPIPGWVGVSGQRFLLEVGKACWRPDVLDDPGRLFALFKYATAISGRRAVFSLSDSIGDLDTHKKKVLSDELGCGMSFVIASIVYGVSRFLDFENARRLGLVTTSAPRSKQPDYLGDLDDGSLIVLEAKGTLGARTYCRSRQIASGCAQVASVTIPSQRTVRSRIVVGTAFRRESQTQGTQAYLGDPDPHEAYDYRFLEDLSTLPSRLHYLRVAALTGDAVVASVLMNRDFAADERALIRRSVAGQEFLGSQLLVEGGGYRLGVFVGLQEGYRHSLLDRNFRRLREQRIEGSGIDLLRDAPTFFPEEDSSFGEPVQQGETLALSEDGTAWVTWLERGP
ncbi:MAG: hypothetical protein ACRELA_05755 [Candidatus Rokuibacteriota bacterium]